MEQLRPSQALDQFFGSLSHSPGLRILDLGEFTQANVQFITSLGHRLTFEDFERSLTAALGPDASRADEVRAHHFLQHSLTYPPEHFDAILIWDNLELVPPQMAAPIVDRLWSVLRPGGSLFACFHAEAKAGPVERFSFRISDAKTLSLAPRGAGKAAQAHNNRSIEKLFSRFDAVKFYLTRDSVREVVVRK
ncbi:MAG: hypothetical protein U0Q16_10730 [Bryobacteraceae bacterium]